MPISKEDRIAFLKQRHLFKDLEEEDIAKIADRLEEYMIQANEHLFTHGDRGKIFYIIYKGKVRIWRKEDGKEVELAVMEDGDKFGEEALLFNRPRSASVTAVEESQFLSLKLTDFNWMLRTYPELKLNLRAIAESHQKARRLRFDWLQPGEVIHLITRRHKADLIFALAKPLVVLILAVFFLLITSLIPPFRTISYIIGFFFLGAGILWGFWEGIDWGNDYFIITNQRVVFLERILLQSASRQEAPMNAIQSVNIDLSQLGRIFGFGTVLVRTFTGTGSLTLTNVDNPKRFRDLIEEMLLRVREKTEASDLKQMRLSIRQSLGLEPIQPTEPTDEKEDEVKEDISWRPTFLKTREVKGDVITYHKHWLVLILKVWFPFLVFIGMMALSIILYANSLTLGGMELPLVSTFCGLGIGYLISLGFIIYRYLDWRNDIYRLTKDKVIDTERKPLGREYTKSAPIKNILSLEHQREGLHRLLLNYGNVNIVVADTKLDFINVHNPAQVQQDIFNRVEQLKHEEEKATTQRERARMAEWLKAYHEVWVDDQEAPKPEDDKSESEISG